MLTGLSGLLAVLIVLMSYCQPVDPNLKFTLTLRQYEKVKDSLLSIVGRTASDPKLLNRAARLNVSDECFSYCATFGLPKIRRPGLP